eukprot:UN26971
MIAESFADYYLIQDNFLNLAKLEILARNPNHTFEYFISVQKIIRAVTAAIQPGAGHAPTFSFLYLTKNEKRSWERSITMVYRWCCLCINNISHVFKHLPEGLQECL